MSDIRIIDGNPIRGRKVHTRPLRFCCSSISDVCMTCATTLALLVLSSCYHSTATVAKMNEQEIRAVSDWDICNAYEEKVSRTEVVMSEIKRRGLDCDKKIADYKRRYPKPAPIQIGRNSDTRQEGSTNTGSVPSSGRTINVTVAPFSIPVEEGECPQTRFKDLTEEESKALHYLFVKSVLKNWGCLQEMKADKKIRVRGQTVVKYTATVTFPKGYRTACLNAPTGGGFQGWDVWLQQTSTCHVSGDDPLGPPTKPGTVRVIQGEEII